MLARLRTLENMPALETKASFATIAWSQVI